MHLKLFSPGSYAILISLLSASCRILISIKNMRGIGLKENNGFLKTYFYISFIMDPCGKVSMGIYIAALPNVLVASVRAKGRVQLKFNFSEDLAKERQANE